MDACDVNEAATAAVTGPVGAAGIDKTECTESDETPEEAPIGERLSETLWPASEVPPGS